MKRGPRALYRRCPEYDCSGDESKAACSVALLLEAAVPDLAESAEKDGPGQSIASLAFVETGVNAAAEVDALQPGQDEERSLDSFQLAQSHGEAVLARIAAQLAKHQRSRYGALFDGSGEAKDLVPVRADCSEVDSASDHGRKRPIFGLAIGEIKFRVAEVTDARREAEAEQVHESEDMVREAGCVGVMLLDPQAGLMVKQPVEDVGGVAHADVDDFGAERRVLV